MKWLFLLLMFVAFPAHSVFWFQFVPCGFKATFEDNVNGMEPLYTPAPNLPVMLWRIPPTAVIQIVGVKRVRGEVECSWLSINGDQWLVVGTPEQIYNTLAYDRVTNYRNIKSIRGEDDAKA